jgi:hypothetical protein
VPEVFDVDGCDLTLEKIDGPTMLQALTRSPPLACVDATVVARALPVVGARRLQDTSLLAVEGARIRRLLDEARTPSDG